MDVYITVVFNNTSAKSLNVVYRNFFGPVYFNQKFKSSVLKKSHNLSKLYYVHCECLDQNFGDSLKIISNNVIAFQSKNKAI